MILDSRIRVFPMKNLRSFLLLVLPLLISSPSFATDAGVDGVTIEQPTPAGHSASAETTSIRKHHLKRLEDRVNISAQVLQQSCRYESEISTAPPAKRVILSFDDGPDVSQTEYILEVLRKHEIAGAFFLIGEKAKSHPELVAKILAGGRHTVGNHSWDHPNFHDLSTAQQAEEVLKYEETPSGGPVKLLFRYPYGNSTCATNDLLHKRGYRIVGWHVDSCDWAFDKDGSVDAREALSCGVLAQNRNNFVEHVVSAVRAHKGGIVLMHEIHANTIRKLDEVIGRLKEEGFVFGSIEDIDFARTLH